MKIARILFLDSVMVDKFNKYIQHPISVVVDQ